MAQATNGAELRAAEVSPYPDAAELLPWKDQEK
jgi:hypothetical protein